MNYKYQLKTDIITDEAGEKVAVYGVTATDGNGNILDSVSEVFFDKSEAEKFVSLCNSEELDISHLPYVIEDLMV